MSDFNREERYIVIKMKDLKYASAENKLLRVLQDAGIPTRRCVVVEADWPEYETVWKMIEARCSGRPSEIAALAEQVEKIRAALDIAHAHADSLADSPEEMRIVNAARLLPDLASPVLNRIRAEGMKEAFLLYSPNDTAQDWVDKIIARAAELEKTNG